MSDGDDKAATDLRLEEVAADLARGIVEAATDVRLRRLTHGPERDRPAATVGEIAVEVTEGSGVPIARRSFDLGDGRRCTVRLTVDVDRPRQATPKVRPAPVHIRAGIRPGTLCGHEKTPAGDDFVSRDEAYAATCTACLGALLTEKLAAPLAVHVLRAGLPLCGFSWLPPQYWPEGHKWVRDEDRGDATCVGCIAVMYDARNAGRVIKKSELDAMLADGRARTVTDAATLQIEASTKLELGGAATEPAVLGDALKAKLETARKQPVHVLLHGIVMCGATILEPRQIHEAVDISHCLDVTCTACIEHAIEYLRASQVRASLWEAAILQRGVDDLQAKLPTKPVASSGTLGGEPGVGVPVALSDGRTIYITGCDEPIGTVTAPPGEMTEDD